MYRLLTDWSAPEYWLLLLVCGGSCAVIAHYRRGRPLLWFVIGLLVGIWVLPLAFFFPGRRRA